VDNGFDFVMELDALSLNFENEKTVRQKGVSLFVMCNLRVSYMYMCCLKYV
jgi:hypothetical protein